MLLRSSQTSLTASIYFGHVEGTEFPDGRKLEVSNGV